MTAAAPQSDAIATLRAAEQLGAANAWFAEHTDDDIGSAYRWIKDNDPVLLGEIQSCQELRRALERISNAAWRAGDGVLPDDAVPDAVFWTVAMLNSGSAYLSFAKARRLEFYVFCVRSWTTRAQVARDLVDAVRGRFATAIDGGVRTGLAGWVRLLSFAAYASYQGGALEVGSALADEAWHLRALLPDGEPESAVVLVNMARAFQLTTVRAADREERLARVPAVVERLEHARGETLRYRDETSIMNLIAIGLSGNDLYYMLQRGADLEFLTAGRARLAILRQAQSDMWQTFGLDAVGDPARQVRQLRPKLSERLRSALGRLMLELGNAAADLGDPEGAAAHAEASVACDGRAAHWWDARLLLARIEPDRRQQIRWYEQILRDVENGQLDTLSRRQRERILRRLAYAADQLTKLLYRWQRPMAAWFWEQQRDAWSAAARQLEGTLQARVEQMRMNPPSESTLGTDVMPDVDDSADELAVASAEEPEAPPADRAAAIIRGVLSNRDREHVPGLVLALLGAGIFQRGSEGPVDGLAEALREVDRWEPERRSVRPGRVSLSGTLSGTELVRACWELADEFAGGYAGYLRPEILLKLSRLPGLAPDRRRALAQEATTVSSESGRLLEAVRAATEDMLMSEVLSDRAGEEAAARRACALLHDVLAEARDTADLVDLAKALLSESTQLAVRLAKRGYAQLAFTAAHAAVGSLVPAFMSDPRLAEEYELIEQRKQNRTPELDARLYGLMLDRIRSEASVQVGRSKTPAVAAKEFGGPVAFVQLLHGKDVAWALTAVTGTRQTQYFTTRLAIDGDRLRELREYLWTGLRPTRPAAAAAAALTKLHKLLIEPIMAHLRGVAAIVFIPDEQFSGIPLHAAKSPTGYLVEQYQVTYASMLGSKERPRRPKRTQRTALVGGWDPNINAPGEADDVFRQLADFGYQVVRPRRATEGARLMLDPKEAYDMIHIAAHGEFFAWPRSTSSVLRLSSRVEVTAGNWLRDGCRPDVAFINACTVGRPAPHAGDLNGFPLALRIRGARAVVAALTYIDPVHAHVFAAHFYESLASADTLTAYRSAITRAIRSGAPPSSWAPYLHSGVPVRL